MNSNEILDCIGDAKGEYIWDAQKIRNGEISIQKNIMPKKRIWLMAAVIGLMLLLVGCAVVYVMSLQDIAFGSKQQEYYDGSVQERTLLSIQGIQGTPGYLATKEWYEWLSTYDVDGAIRYSDEAFSEDFGEDYYAYSLYSRDMKDKLDEICSKYDLELLGKMVIDPDIVAGCEALQIPGILRPGVDVEADWGEICYYSNGSFDVEGYVRFLGQEMHIVSFRCHRKNAFTELYASIGPEGTYEEWNYTTSYGVDVLMILDRGPVRNNATMIVDRGEYVFVCGFTEFDTLNLYLPDRECMESFAEAFNFTAEPKAVTPENMAKAEERLEQKFEAEEKELEKLMLGYSSYGYDSQIKTMMANSTHPELWGFVMIDLNGDGVEELLVGENGYIREVFTKTEEGTRNWMPTTFVYPNTFCYGSTAIGFGYIPSPSYIYLCEQNTLAYVYDFAGDGVAYHFAEIQDGEALWTNRIIYNPEMYGDEPWQKHGSNPIDHNTNAITQEEFESILNSYIRVPVDLLPLSEYPLDENAPVVEKVDILLEKRTCYEDLVRTYQEWADEDIQFCLMDLDEDGQKELIWQDRQWIGVFTVQDGELKVLECGENITVCENGTLTLTYQYLDGNQAHYFFDVRSGSLVLVEYLLYDTDLNPLNPWHRYIEDANGNRKLTEISDQEAQEILAVFKPLALNMEPISQYPMT